MRISNSQIGMDSARNYSTAMRKTAAFQSKTYTSILERRQGSLSFQGMLLGQEEEEGAKTGKNKGSMQDAMLDLKNKYQVSGASRISSKDAMDSLEKIRAQCIQYLMELFGYGKEKIHKNMTSLSQTGGAALVSSASVSTTVLTGTIRETYMEEETTSFRTGGSVVTADGRTIDFQMEVEMSRSFQAAYEQSYELLYQNVNTCDPLVINLDNNIAEVSDQKFLFDIDGDGILDQVSELGSGSGYLALDRNEDGKINDGTELFGPESGNGFADLAQYDEDGNGWIDENDAIWEKLLIWTKNEKGEDLLYHLSEKGIGAICLDNQSTEFSLNSLRDNHTNAIIRSTGIFLYENGTVGTVQHLDMAK